MVSNKLIANANSLAAFLSLMGNEKRLLVVSYLTEGEMSVGALAEKAAQPIGPVTASDQAASAQCCRDSPRPTDDLYSCQSEAVRELLRMLDGIFGENDLSRMTLRLRRAGNLNSSDRS